MMIKLLKINHIRKLDGFVEAFVSAKEVTVEVIGNSAAYRYAQKHKICYIADLEGLTPHWDEDEEIPWDETIF